MKDLIEYETRRDHLTINKQFSTTKTCEWRHCVIEVNKTRRYFLSSNHYSHRHMIVAMKGNGDWHETFNSIRQFHTSNDVEIWCCQIDWMSVLLYVIRAETSTSASFHSRIQERQVCLSSAAIEYKIISCSNVISIWRKCWAPCNCIISWIWWSILSTRMIWATWLSLW